MRLVGVGGAVAVLFAERLEVERVAARPVCRDLADDLTLLFLPILARIAVDLVFFLHHDLLVVD